MADTKLNSTLFSNRSDIFVAAGVILVLAMMLIPLPTFLLDSFMSFNLMLSLLVILIVLYSKNTTDFSIFPTLLLVSTVFGLALNISSTRLILSKGAEFDGKLVRAFSQFVVGTAGPEGLVIGFIIFIILIAVQFIVITKGATRVAEVAARFTLDGMVQKQMSIDSELASGALTEDEAIQKRRNLQKEVDFYSAMDGASKFVSGNVKVGILITAINIIGGIIVGMIYHNEPFQLALNNYISLTIGDGLVTQFPSLIISTATGIVVTRSISDGSFGSDISDQFTREARVYFITAVFLVLLAVLPGFPWYVLLPMAAVMGFTGTRLNRKKNAAEAAERAVSGSEDKEEARTSDIPGIEPLDPLSLELGYGLIPLVDKEKGADLLERITRIRRETASELGLVVPKIRVRDNMKLEPSEYCFKIKGVDISRADIRMNHYLAINSGGTEEELQGEKTTDPAFGLPAQWISEDQRDKAEQAGYLVVDPPSIIATHLTGIIKKYASEILGRQEVQSIIDSMHDKYPAVVDEVKKVLNLGEIQKVLQSLLREQISIRNMVVILETLGDFAVVSKDSVFLTEKTRQALGRQICLQYADENKVLNVLTIDPEIESRIIESKVETIEGYIPVLDREFMSSFVNSVTNEMMKYRDENKFIVILCSEEARPLVKKAIERELPAVAVLSARELKTDINFEILGEITF